MFPSAQPLMEHLCGQQVQNSGCTVKVVDNNGGFTGPVVGWLWKSPSFFECKHVRKLLKQKEICITCDEDTGVLLKRWGVAVLLAVPPAHLPGQTAESASGQILHPAETTSAKQAQQRRSGHADRHTRFHVQ